MRHGCNFLMKMIVKVSNGMDCKKVSSFFSKGIF